MDFSKTNPPSLNPINIVKDDFIFIHLRNFSGLMGDSPIALEYVIDVAQNVAQEPIFYYYGQVLIGGPFKGFWALGESLGPDTSVRQSPRDHKYL